MLAPDLAGKRLALLKEVVLATPRVAVLVNTANPGDQATVRRLEAAAQPLGIWFALLCFYGMARDDLYVVRIDIPVSLLSYRSRRHLPSRRLQVSAKRPGPDIAAVMRLERRVVITRDPPHATMYPNRN